VAAADNILATQVPQAVRLYLVLFRLLAVAEVPGITTVIQNQAVQVVVEAVLRSTHIAEVAVEVLEVQEQTVVQQQIQEMLPLCKVSQDKVITAVLVTMTAAVLVVLVVRELLLRLAELALHEQVAVAVHLGLVHQQVVAQVAVAQQVLVVAVVTVIQPQGQIPEAVAVAVTEAQHEVAMAQLVL
jgi:hypothetical protein